MQKTKAFTLIELLVVIAIIGILSGLIIVSMSGAQNAAKDARIKAAMDQFRSVAEIFKLTNGGTYGANPNLAGITTATCGTAAASSMLTYADAMSLCNDIQATTAAGALTLYADAATSTTYCIQKVLPGGQTWCIDSIGNIGCINGIGGCVSTTLLAGCDSTAGTHDCK